MNPVLRKDLIGLLRLKRVAAIQICFVAVLAVLTLASWPQGGVVGGSAAIGEGAGLIRTDDSLLFGLVMGQIVLLILFVPGVASVALTGEKEANTLEMLYASRLKPRQIITGKVGLAVIYPLLLLVSGLPFVGLLSWRGDVPIMELLVLYLILLTGAIFLAMLSLAISAVCRQSSTALVLAYLTVLVVCGGVLVPAAIMIREQSGLTAEILHYIRAVSPVGAGLSRLRGAAMIEVGPAATMLPIWKAFFPVAGAIILGSFIILVAKLRKAPSSSEALGAAGAADGQRSLARRLMFLIDPKKTPKPFRGFNPLYQKERRTSKLRSGRWMIRITYGALFLSLALAAMSLYGGPEHSDLLANVAVILVALQVGLIGLVAPSLTSASVSSELEEQTFEMLRMTRLRGGQVFWGKFIPAFLPAVLPIVALLPAFGAIAFIDQGYLTRFLWLAPVMLMAVVFCCTLGLTCSTMVTNTARATVAAYLITAAMFILPLLGWWAGGSQISHQAGAYIGFISPLVIALNMMPGGSSAIAQLYQAHLWLTALLCVGMLLVARGRLTLLLHRG